MLRGVPAETAITAHGPDATLPERVRRSCAAVAAGASLVAIDGAALERMADELAAQLDAGGAPETPATPPEWRDGDPERRTGLILALDAVNFGSGWHPLLRKRPGLSGARTVAAAFTEWWIGAGWPGPRQLAELLGPTRHDGVTTLAPALGQSASGAVRPLLDAFCASLEELADWVAERFDQRWSAVPAAAGSSAARLAELLATLSLWDDRSPHPALAAAASGGPEAVRPDPGGRDPGVGTEVWLYKRAQIAAADLDLAGVTATSDLECLTAMADNLVPHVLRLDGVVVVDGALVERIEREELLIAGEVAEVELRAVAVHAVELLVAAVRARGQHLSAAELDRLLWWRGRLPRYKAVPRHRCRTTAY